MYIRFKKKWYNVKIKNAFKIWKRQVLLMLRRIKRFALRMFDVFKKDLLVLLFSIIGYVLFVVYVQIKSMNTPILESIWGTKAEVFTVFVVVALNAFITYERGWRKHIREWYWVYIEYMWKCEEYIREFNKILDIYTDYICLKNKEGFNDLKIFYENSYKDIKVEKLNSMVKVIKQLNNDNKELRSKVYNNEYLKNKKEFENSYNYFLNISSTLLEKIEEKNLDIEEDIFKLYGSLYYIIVDISMLWRTEVNLDKEIVKILIQNGCDINM